MILCIALNKSKYVAKCVVTCLKNIVIQTYGTIKTKLPLQFCMKGLIIMIGQLGPIGR